MQQGSKQSRHEEDYTSAKH